jgi:hypothetical protein
MERCVVLWLDKRHGDRNFIPDFIGNFFVDNRQDLIVAIHADYPFPDFLRPVFPV